MIKDCVYKMDSDLTVQFQEMIPPSTNDISYIYK